MQNIKDFNHSNKLNSLNSLKKMNIKRIIIDLLNLNYRTVLSYGESGLVPDGEFVVKDIKGIKNIEVIKDVGDIEKNKILKMLLESAQIVLSKIGDEKTQIVMPGELFMQEYREAATENSERFNLSNDMQADIHYVIKDAESKLMDDEMLEDLKDPVLIPMDHNKIEFYIDGKKQASNYSLCPVDISKFPIRIKERTIENERNTKEEIMQAIRIPPYIKKRPKPQPGPEHGPKHGPEREL